MASLRFAARAMVESGVPAVLVESPLGPVGLVTAGDLVEAIASGADPDVLWAGEVSRPATKLVGVEQNPVTLGEEMVAEGFEVVAVMDEGIPVGVACALDVLEAVLPRPGDAHAHRCET
jgi:CBS domain-containing protein